MVKETDRYVQRDGINLNKQRLKCCVLGGLVTLMIGLHNEMMLTKSENRIILRKVSRTSKGDMVMKSLYPYLSSRIGYVPIHCPNMPSVSLVFLTVSCPLDMNVPEIFLYINFCYFSSNMRFADFFIRLGYMNSNRIQMMNWELAVGYYRN